MGLGDIVRKTREEMRVVEVEKIDPTGKRVLLVYVFTGLGDLILLAPVIKALLARGVARIGVVAPESGARILARANLGSRVVRYTPDDAIPEHDIAVDLTQRAGVDAQALMGDAPVKLGFGATDVRLFADRHWSRATAVPLLPLGVTEPDYAVTWRGTPAAETWARARWGREDGGRGGGGPRVLVVPGGRSKEKQWAGWRTVIEALQSRHAARAIMLGAPWEADAMRGLGDAYTGRDLAKLVALVKSADLVLASDTGPMHLAFALGIPTVALFLRMAPESWGPPFPDARFAITRVSEGSDPTDWVIASASRLIAR